MRICVVGAGAIGGHLAVRLAQAKHAVSIVVRPPTRDAVERDGLTLVAGNVESNARVHAVTSTSELHPHDVVFVTLKATALAAIADQLDPLLGPKTPIVFVLNGIPWWYFHSDSQAARPRPTLEGLDPDGALSRHVDVARVIGCVVFSSNEVIAPGVVRNRSINRNEWTLGEIDGALSDRVEAFGAMLTDAGLNATASPHIRRAVWNKLVATNIGRAPLCALLDRDSSVFENADLKSLAQAIMVEAMEVASAWDIHLEIDTEAAFKPGGLTAGHVPSLLQDYRLGRKMEIEAMIGSVQEFARSADVRTPNIDVVAALLKQRAIDRGLYP